LAESLVGLHRLDEAESELLKYLAEHNGDPRARLAQARLAAMRGQYEACLQNLEVLRAYMESQPIYRGRMQPLLLLMSESLRRLGQAERAEEVRQRAMTETEPSWPDPLFTQVAERRVGLKKYLNEADAMFNRRDYPKSIALLQRTVDAYPESIWAKILLARALIRTGAPDSQYPDRENRLNQAVELLQDALKRDPNSAEAVFRLAVAKGYQRRFAEAVDLYRQAVATKPDFAMAYYNLANLLWRELGDAEGANQAFEGALRAQPDFVDGHYLYGMILLRQGRFADAEQHFDRAVRLQPGDSRFRQALAEARQRQRGPAAGTSTAPQVPTAVAPAAE
jgi:tetratricopeptide (TPR) repeat protein